MSSSNSATDWLPITIKFRGKCVECGKEIKSGQQAFWSKSSKTIRHLEDCSLRNANQASSSKDRQESATHKQEKQFSSKKKYRQTTLPKCFICGKEKLADDDDEYDSLDYNFYESKSESYICQSCLQKEDAFEAYQQAFLQKINKYLR